MARGDVKMVRRWQSGCGAVVLSAGMLAACSSSGGSASATSTPLNTTCRQVSAVLGNGPDPDADPVGYADAQILPLRQIRATTDPELERAIDDLATAYQQSSGANGVGSAAKQAVSQASDRINALCPGAAS